MENIKHLLVWYRFTLILTQFILPSAHFLQVFPFGSVPLKTFLPDGDIDLTALSYQNEEEALARDICSILENDKQDSQFQVEDVQYIRAQVLFFPVDLFLSLLSDTSIIISLNIKS